MSEAKLTKIVLYCHNRYGFGHIIRSIRIAESLYESGKFEPIILTGCSQLDALEIPDGIEVERITPIPDDFDPNLYDVLSDRAKHIENFVRKTSPDLMLVDTLPFGYRKELRAILMAKLNGELRTEFILGLPYADEDFSDLRKNPADEEALSAYFKGVKYVNPEWGQEMDNLSFETKQIGMIVGDKPPESKTDSNVILVVSGGGAVSAEMLQPLIASTRTARQNGYHVRFVIGPLANFEAMKTQLGQTENVELIHTSTIEYALKDAKIVVARCGYNSALVLVRTKLPVVFVPFDRSGTEVGEQFVRAKELSVLPNIEWVSEHDEAYAVKLENAIDRALKSTPVERTCPYALDGLDRMKEYLEQLVDEINKSNK